MSRRNNSKREFPIPDPVYNSYLVSLLMVRILKSGKSLLITVNLNPEIGSTIAKSPCSFLTENKHVQRIHVKKIKTKNRFIICQSFRFLLRTTFRYLRRLGNRLPSAPATRSLNYKLMLMVCT